MHRDPFYQQIQSKLASRLDPDAFERCAAALLVKVYPTLVPVRGGDDAGFDGAIAHDGVSPYPLICTTGKDVAANLRASIESAKKRWKGASKAVLATPRSLTPRVQRQLFEVAGNLGVQLIQIHEAAWFSDALYSHSSWCRELLGLTGDPPPFSQVPESPRRGFIIEPIGRAEDIEWLEQSSDDLILSGHPGSGKSYLHQYLASAGKCLFAVEDDRTRLANGLREQKPTTVVIDDAHLRLDRLRTLVHLREEIGASFRVVVNCWPSHVVSVANVLGRRPEEARELRLLSRDEIAAVVKAAGLLGPPRLIQMIVEQSENKPGLAVALAQACLLGSADRVWEGEVLLERLAGPHGPLSDERDRLLLAAFALGGESGMRVDTVAEFLRDSLQNTFARISTLAAGGVIYEHRDRLVEVRPPVLRYVLVRDVFFGRHGRIDPSSLSSSVPSIAAATDVLLGARHRGAAISLEKLQEYAVKADATDVWQHFAWLSRDAATLILDKHPERIEDTSSALLHFQPIRTLHALFERATTNTLAAKSCRDTVRRWVHGSEPRHPDAVARREGLLGALETWQGARSQSDLTLSLLAVVIEPTFEWHGMEPGSGRTFSWASGLLLDTQLAQLATYWPRVLRLARDLVPSSYAPLMRELETWCHPHSGAMIHHEVEESTLEWLAKEGGVMVDAFAASFPQSPALANWAARLARVTPFTLGSALAGDPVYDTLFGRLDRAGDWEETERIRREDIRAVANEWASSTPEEVCTRLSAYDADHKRFGMRQWDAGPWLCEELAARITDHVGWCVALMDGGLSSERVRPFLTRAIESSATGWDRVLARALEQPQYGALAWGLLLPIDPPRTDLLQKAMKLVGAESTWHWQIWSRDELPVETVRMLLEHPSESVRTGAALNEWRSGEIGHVRGSLRDAWRSAILGTTEADHTLEEILISDGSLCAEWLHGQVLRHGRLYRFDEAMPRLVKCLTRQHKLQLLALMHDNIFEERLFCAILKSDPSLYADYLAGRVGDHRALLPLRRVADEEWIVLATIALDAGFSPEDLAQACTPTHWGGSGPMSVFFAERMKEYDSLRHHPDARLHAAGQAGWEWAKDHYEFESHREREEAMRGG